MSRLILIITMIISIIGCSSSLSGKKAIIGKYEYTRQNEYSGIVHRDILIWIDRKFGEADKISIDDAINQWNYGLNGQMKLRVVSLQFDMGIEDLEVWKRYNGWLILKIWSNSKLVPSQEKRGYVTIGFTDKLGGNLIYLVRDRLENGDIFGVMMHEIGHLLGVDHMGERLMSESYNKANYQCIDRITMEAVSERYGLDLRKLNYCIDKY